MGHSLSRHPKGATIVIVAELQSPPQIDEHQGLALCVDGRDVYDLKVGFNTVGRLPESDVVLNDRSISRRHCVVRVLADGWCEVQDACSCNGTYVNGELILGSRRLRPGDEIQVGSHRLKLSRSW